MAQNETVRNHYRRRAAASYADGRSSYSDAGVIVRLVAALNVRVRECFFADLVVLVESEIDAAALQATFTLRNVDPDALGIAILPVDGKSNIDIPLIILQQLGIPAYALWDGDAKDNTETNARLLRLLGHEAVARPKTEVKVTHAVFEDKLETTVQAEFGTIYETIFETICTQYSIRRHRVEKRAAVVVSVYRELNQQGSRSATLNLIVDAILALYEKSHAARG